MAAPPTSLSLSSKAGSFAGLSNGNWSQIPYFSEQFVGATREDWQPLIDWGLFTEPLPVNGEEIHYAQSKTLGGSSERNQMIYHRGSRGSYDRWAEEVGDNNFNWDVIKNYFERSVSFTPPPAMAMEDGLGVRASNATPNYTLSAFANTNGGQGGPVHVSYPAYAQPISSYGPAAFAGIGMNASQKGFSSGDLMGYGYNRYTIDPKNGAEE